MPNDPSNPSNDALWKLMALQSLSGTGKTLPTSPQPNPLQGLQALYGKGTLLTPSCPDPPSTTTYSQLREVEQRFQKRLEKLNDVLPIRTGRVVPDDEDLIIGDAKRINLAVLFLDICRFSQIPSDDENGQDRVFKVLNLFMAEMLWIVRKFAGDFEKNTGDGLMAYFKSGPEAESAKQALDAAITMHCYNDQVISQRLKALSLPEVKFRIGIETGLVTIANVGVRGDHHSLVAIGTTANIACKLMNKIPNGGIVIGNRTRELLPPVWKDQTTNLGGLDGFVIKGTQTPYPAWAVKYRAPEQTVAFYFSNILSGK